MKVGSEAVVGLNLVLDLSTVLRVSLNLSFRRLLGCIVSCRCHFTLSIASQMQFILRVSPVDRKVNCASPSEM